MLFRLSLLLCLTVPLPAASLKIATYNLGNYNSTNRMTDDGYRLDYPKPETAKRALLAVIQSLDADVLVMQEMGSLPYLEELQRDLRNLGLAYPHRHLVLADDDTRHIAILSRIPWARAVSHTTVEFKYFDRKERLKRGLLEVEFSTSSGPLTIWGIHLKSRFTDRPDDPASTIKRAGEAVAIRDLILRRHKDPQNAAYILLGDFNDIRTARPLRACLNRGQHPITEMLPATDSRAESWTRFHAKDDSYERIDFILCSPALLPHVRNRRASICDAPPTLQASDHRPVTITLDWK